MNLRVYNISKRTSFKEERINLSILSYFKINRINFKG